MICPNFAGVNILALLKDSEHNLDEVWHAMIDKETSVQCEKLDIQPLGANAKICNIFAQSYLERIVVLGQYFGLSESEFV